MAMERGSVWAVVRQRVNCTMWNLHLHELPYDIAVFQYASPETAMKHASRWLGRHPQPSVGEIRRRTDAMFLPARTDPELTPRRG